jgi:hypothetical protein
MVILPILVLLWQIVVYVRDLNPDTLAATDNRTWIIAQLEVDRLKLEVALMNATSSERADFAALAETVAIRTAIFQSRIRVAITALEAIDPNSDIEKALAFLNSRFVRYGALSGVENIGEMNDLSDLLAAVRADSRDIRLITLSALTNFSLETMERRRHYNRSLTSAVVLSTILLVIVAGTSILLIIFLLRLRGRANDLNNMTADLHMTLDAYFYGTVIADEMGRSIAMNGAAKKMFDLEESDGSEMCLFDFVLPSNFSDDGEANGWSYPDHTGILMVNKRMSGRTALGRKFPIEVSVTKVRFSDGNHKLICYLRDLTEQEDAEIELRQARDQAQSDANAKARFVAIASHEMRTPMTNVISALDVLGDGSDTKGRKKLLDTARKSAGASLAQIEELLEFVQFGSQSEPSGPLDPIAIVHEVFELQQLFAEKQRNRLLLKTNILSKQQPFLGMPKTYKRVLSNLVNNAVKFTTEGTIEVTISVQESSNGQTLLHTNVKDNGIGIAHGDQNRVFDEFETIRPVGSGFTMVGNGLGLSIVRRGIEQMGGTINLESDLGRGSTFWYDLELRAHYEAHNEDKPIAANAVLLDQKLHVLVVDDNPASRSVLGTALDRLGHSFELAPSGAIAVMNAFANCFDFIFMDLNLPDIDGFEATRQIRETGASRRSKIIGMTAQIHYDYLSLIELAGMNELLQKPISLKDLSSKLISFEPEQHSAANTNQSSKDKADVRSLLGENMYRALLDSCLMDCEIALRTWPASVDEKASEEYLRNVHNALGSASVLCEFGLQTVLSRAEGAAFTGNVKLLCALRGDVEACLYLTRLETSYEKVVVAQLRT